MVDKPGGYVDLPWKSKAGMRYVLGNSHGENSSGASTCNIFNSTKRPRVILTGHQITNVYACFTYNKYREP